MRGLQETQSTGANVILHAFDWKYADIAQRAAEISELGYGSVLVSPPMKSAQDERWWQRYQPQDYRVIDNALGNTTDFKNRQVFQPTWIYFFLNWPKHEYVGST